MSIKLTTIFNPQVKFQDISPNEVIHSPEKLLAVLIKVITQLKGVYQTTTQWSELLQLIYNYLGIEEQCLLNIQLRDRYSKLYQDTIKLRNNHIYYSERSYWKNRYKVFYTNTNTDLVKVLHKYTVTVPETVRALTSVFQKRTSFFDRHYFNIQSSKFRAVQLNLSYFESEYKHFIESMVTDAFGNDANKMHVTPLGDRILSHRIIGEVHEPSTNLIRYVNKQNNNWQVLHPPLDFGYYYITHSIDDKSVQCVFQNRYYAGLTRSMPYPLQQGNYCTTFSVFNSASIVTPIPQRFKYEPMQLTHIWPTPRNMQLHILQRSSETINTVKQFKHINAPDTLFSNLQNTVSKSSFAEHDNYRSWLYAELHRGVYPQYSAGKLDGYRISPAWYSYAYTPYDTFRGKYKCEYFAQLNVVDPSDIFSTVMPADDRITMVQAQSDAALNLRFGTAEQAMIKTRNFTRQYAYDSEFQQNADSVLYDDICIDYNQYSTLSNVTFRPDHPTDPDYNASALLHHTNSLFLKKFYHPDRYVCIPDKTNALINGGNIEKEPPHISILDLSQHGYLISNGDDPYGVYLRKYISNLKNDIWNWSAVINSYMARRQAGLYRHNVTVGGYDYSAQYGVPSYYPTDQFNTELIMNTQSYKNTYFSNMYQSWITYTDRNLSGVSASSREIARVYSSKLNWHDNTAKQNSILRVVSWYNSLFMKTTYDNSVIDSLNPEGIQVPYLDDKMGYYNSVLPNYLVSQNVSVITDALSDKDYRVWKYYDQSGSVTHSNTIDSAALWNFTYSNTTFDPELGDTNLFAVVYTDNNRGNGYGFMNEAGEYLLSFKFKYEQQPNINTPQYNYNGGINSLRDKFGNSNAPVSMRYYQQLFQSGKIKCRILPYNGITEMTVLQDEANVSVMPSDYQNGYKRLIGFFNPETMRVFSTKSGMCITTQSDFKFMFDRYGQYITHMTNNTKYFQYNGKNYLDVLSMTSGSVIVSEVGPDNWAQVTMSLSKYYQGNGMLSWLYFQNIGAFSDCSKYIGIKQLTIAIQQGSVDGTNKT